MQSSITLERICRTVPSSGGVFYPEKKGKNPPGKKFDLIVIRVNNDGDLCISRPCYNCLNMMKAVNISKVYYVDSDRNLVCENVKDMISIHASTVTRYIHAVNNGMNYLGSERLFFEKILKEMFPSEVKRGNFDTFLKHDLSNVLPEHTYIIKSSRDVSIITIFDADKKEIIKSRLIE